MHPRGSAFVAPPGLILASLLLMYSVIAVAQDPARGGMRGSASGSNKPTGVVEGEELKDFHQALALQATGQQVADFQALMKSADGARAELLVFQQSLRAANPSASSPSSLTLGQALENARARHKSFQDGLSTEQKAGLRDILKRVGKADSDLDQETKRLEQSVESKAASAEMATRAESLGKALTEFFNQQFALGREMSITLASGQDLSFTLPRVNSPVNIANRTIAIPVTGALSQVGTAGVQRTFKLELHADLSDLQQNMTALLREQLDTSNQCGQRVAITEARLTPASPASLLVVRLHFERWSCTRLAGQQSSTELAEGDGTVEMKLSAAVDQTNTLKIVATPGRIDANGMMAEALRSGSLGEDLHDTVAQAVLAAVQGGSNFKIVLPPAVQNSATIQGVKFEDSGVGTLRLVETGQISISDEQANQLANQLNQTLSVQGTSAK